jgi:hypothetical protein
LFMLGGLPTKLWKIEPSCAFLQSILWAGKIDLVFSSTQDGAGERGLWLGRAYSGNQPLEREHVRSEGCTKSPATRVRHVTSEHFCHRVGRVGAMARNCAIRVWL